MKPGVTLKDGSNPILLALEIAYQAHARGEITVAQLIEVMDMAIDATALCNGYAEKYGLPSQQGKVRRG